VIEAGTVDGKKATLSYVDDMLVPVDDKADATMIVAWVEDGHVLYLRVPGKPVKDAWREDLHPRGQPENKGQFGPGGGGSSKAKAKALRLHAKRHAQAQAQHKEAQAVRSGLQRMMGVTGTREAAKAEVAAVTKAEKGKYAKGTEDFTKAKISLTVPRGGEEAFLERWNEKVGMTPEEFKKEFLGGVPSEMKIRDYGSGSFAVEGTLQLSEGGPMVGRYEREINVNDKTAYSAFFKISDQYTGTDIGKKVLGGNVAVYEKLGIESVGVTANIDVGGYAWAKYGYVPTQSAWNSLRQRLQGELSGGTSRAAGIPSRGSRHDEDENTMEADDWGLLSEDQQTEVRDRWMRDNRQDYLDSEIDSWRESGQALEQAKRDLNYEYDSSNQIPRWADEELNELRDKRKEEGEAEIPFTNQQLFEALKMSEYESSGGDGQDDPEFEWDDDKLQEPKDLPPAEQMTLPGMKPPDYSKRIDDDTREEITDRLVYAFNSKADSDQNFIDTPDYLGESVDEYMDQAWDEKDDREKLEVAEGYDLHRIPAPEDEDADEEEKQKEMEMEKAKPEEKKVEEKKPEEEKPKARTLLEIANDPKPKAIWEFSDAPGGKAVLLAVTKYHSWSGKLNLKDKDSYDRFKKYVGRKKEPKRAA
jgi:hypothetical protein